jgi:hypothetical protein
MTIQERIIETLGRSCREGGGLSKVLAEEKLDDLICLLGEAAGAEADTLRQLAEERIVLLTSSEFSPRHLKSGRELDRYLDELCEVSYCNHILSKRLCDSLNRGIQGQITLVSSLNK